MQLVSSRPSKHLKAMAKTLLNQLLAVLLLPRQLHSQLQLKLQFLGLMKRQLNLLTKPAWHIDWMNDEPTGDSLWELTRRLVAASQHRGIDHILILAQIVCSIDRSIDRWLRHIGTLKPSPSMVSAGWRRRRCCIETCYARLYSHYGLMDFVDPYSSVL